MGYTTDFTGAIQITPPLNKAEMEFLHKFAYVRHMWRTRGPYFVNGGGDGGQDIEPDVIDHNSPDPSQPGLWCQWIPTEDGTALQWDQAEKFYNSRTFAWEQKLIRWRHDNQTEIRRVFDQHAHQLYMYQFS